nr:unnamed protein product [Digitaria exilis]
MLHTVRFLCSVVAAVARLIRELRRRTALLMASSTCSPSPVVTPCPAGLISAFTPLPSRRKKAAAVQKQPLAVAPPAAVLPNGEQAEGRRTKKEAWAARRRPARLVIPVADDVGEVAAGWGAAAANAAAKEADVVVEGEGFRVASRAGPRHAMEDAYAVVTHKNDGDPQLAFYGVFDGHGGRAAVDFVSRRLGENVVSAVLAAATCEEASPTAAEEEEDAVSAAIRLAYLATDSELLAQHQGVTGGGSCAATAVVKGGELYVAHVGDCRAVLSHNGGAAAALTADHTCAADSERQRIERDGGYVCRSGGSGVWRVQGSLAVSRSFGDAGLKRWVVAEPAVTKVVLAGGECEFLVVASDGLWDKVGNQEAVDVVSRNRTTACEELVDLARRRGSRDDVTVMVIDLERFV